MLKKILNYLIALVWLVNGLFFKLLDFMPRHELIVSEILGTEYSGILIVLIGLAEIVMVIWVLSKWKSVWCAWAQIAVIMLMNILEFLLVPELLMFGRINIVVAVIFCFIIYIREFKLDKKYASS